MQLAGEAARPPPTCAALNPPRGAAPALGGHQARPAGRSQTSPAAGASHGEPSRSFSRRAEAAPILPFLQTTPFNGNWRRGERRAPARLPRPDPQAGGTGARAGPTAAASRKSFPAAGQTQKPGSGSRGGAAAARSPEGPCRQPRKGPVRPHPGGPRSASNCCAPSLRTREGPHPVPWARPPRPQRQPALGGQRRRGDALWQVWCSGWTRHLPILSGAEPSPQNWAQANETRSRRDAARRLLLAARSAGQRP